MDGEDEEIAHGANRIMAARARKTAPYRGMPSYYDFATHSFRGDVVATLTVVKAVDFLDVQVFPTVTPIHAARIGLGTRSTWHGSRTHSRIITMRIACTAPLTAALPRDAPAHYPHQPRVLLFAIMFGTSIVAVCFTHRFQSD